MHEQAGNLALGQQRLMEIARALCRRPDPAAARRAGGGPAPTRRKQALADVLRQLRGEGMSILLVEHDMDFVMGLADRIVVMEFGTKLIEGTPDEVQAEPGGARRLPRDGALSAMAEPCSSKSRDLHAGYGRAEVLHGLDLTAGAGPGRHRDRPQRRRQVDPAQRADGRAAVAAGTIELRRRADRRCCSLEERVMRGMALVPETRELFAHHDGRGQPAARRATASCALGDKRQRRGARRGLQAVPAPAERRAQLAGTLSGGERQMLAVGRALMAQARAADAGRAQPGPGAAGRARDLPHHRRAARDRRRPSCWSSRTRAPRCEVADYGYVLEMGEIALQGPAARAGQRPARDRDLPRRGAQEDGA